MPLVAAQVGAATATQRATHRGGVRNAHILPTLHRAELRSEEVSRLAGSWLLEALALGEAGGVRGVACALEYQTSCVGKAMPAEE